MNLKVKSCRWIRVPAWVYIYMRFILFPHARSLSPVLRQTAAPHFSRPAGRPRRVIKLPALHNLNENKKYMPI